MSEKYEYNHNLDKINKEAKTLSPKELEVKFNEIINNGVSEPIIDVVKEQEWGVEPVMYFKPGVLTLVD